MSDLVQRLRGEWAVLHTSQDKQQEWLWDLRKEAADRIEHLERLFNRDYEEMRQQAADNARLVEAADKRIKALEASLREIAKERAFYTGDTYIEYQAIARRALEAKHE